MSQSRKRCSNHNVLDRRALLAFLVLFVLPTVSSADVVRSGWDAHRGAIDPLPGSAGPSSPRFAGAQSGEFRPSTDAVWDDSAVLRRPRAFANASDPPFSLDSTTRWFEFEFLGMDRLRFRPDPPSSILCLTYRHWFEDQPFLKATTPSEIIGIADLAMLLSRTPTWIPYLATPTMTTARPIRSASVPSSKSNSTPTSDLSNQSSAAFGTHSRRAEAMLTQSLLLPPIQAQPARNWYDVGRVSGHSDALEFLRVDGPIEHSARVSPKNGAFDSLATTLSFWAVLAGSSGAAGLALMRPLRKQSTGNRHRSRRRAWTRANPPAGPPTSRIEPVERRGFLNSSHPIQDRGLLIWSTYPMPRAMPRPSVSAPGLNGRAAANLPASQPTDPQRPAPTPTLHAADIPLPPNTQAQPRSNDHEIMAAPLTSRLIREVASQRTQLLVQQLLQVDQTASCCGLHPSGRHKQVEWVLTEQGHEFLRDLLIRLLQTHPQSNPVPPEEFHVNPSPLPTTSHSLPVGGC